MLTVISGTGILVLLDVIIYVLPVRLIYKLKVSRNQKMGLLFIFSFGPL